MKVLVIGGGGREHTLAWRLSQCTSVHQVLIAPGNPGSAQVGTNLAATALDIATRQAVDLTIVGPEAPLVDGIVDLFNSQQLTIFGPTQAAARLEGSKAFSKDFIARHGIPTAQYAVANSLPEAETALKSFTYPMVLKADGLAAGKGVVIVHTQAEALRTLQQLFSGELVGTAGARVVLEEFLTGEEVSFIAICDGENALPLEPSQDHKAIFDNDQGPNTGGMGAYSDSRILTAAQRQFIQDSIILPTLAGMKAEGAPFQGFLYAGLMMTPDGPKVLEYNVRLGDPETQCLLHRMDGDLATLLLEAANGRLQPQLLSFKPEPSLCIVLAAAGYPGKVRTGDAITGIAEAEATGAVVFHAGTRLTDQGLVTAGGRVLGVTHSGHDLQTAIDNAYNAAHKIHFDGLQMRTDIGRKGLSRY